MNILKFYFDFRGRITRKQYWLYYGLGMFVFMIAAYIALFAYYWSEGITSQEMVILIGDSIMLNVLFFVFYYITLVAHAKRLRDADYSLWWLVTFIVPILGFLIAGSICAFVKTKPQHTHSEAKIEKDDNNNDEKEI